jgi:hypothetical protein
MRSNRPGKREVPKEIRGIKRVELLFPKPVNKESAGEFIEAI